MRDWLEFIPVWLTAQFLGVLPRRAARAIGIGIGRGAYRLHRRLRRVGERNLQLAFPQMDETERRRILRGVFTTLGRQLADFAHLPKIKKNNVEQWVAYQGLENYLQARARGKGVLFVTAHLGGWEIGSYAHSVYGYPIQIFVRTLDNRVLDRWVQRMRSRAGNRILDKAFARGVLSAMRAGETIGILMDTNMTPPQGVFVDFFGIPACTASVIARIAQRTDAAVVPGFTVWHEEKQRYAIHFEPALQLERSGDEERDAVANTARFTRAIEDYVRRYPEQWLWVHRRWKARPTGEKPLY
jgi:KDO2-lipid IV(A) lauroyltransferase